MRLYPTVLVDKERLHKAVLKILPLIYIGQVILLLAIVVSMVSNPVFTAFILGLGQLAIGAPLWNELYVVPDKLKLADRGTRTLFILLLEALVVAIVFTLYYTFVQRG